MAAIKAKTVWSPSVAVASQFLDPGTGTSAAFHSAMP
jgi:hypothetical protein